MAITTTNIELCLSGAGDNGLGGAIGNAVNQVNTVNNIFDQVTAQQSVAGVIEYRCVFLRNNHPTDAWNMVKLFFDALPTQPGITLEIGKAPQTPNNPTEILVSEEQIPANVTFSSANGASNGVPLTNDLNLNHGDYQGFWLKRIIAPNQVPAGTNQFVIGATGDSI